MKLLCKLGIHRPLEIGDYPFNDKAFKLAECSCGKMWTTDSSSRWFGHKKPRQKLQLPRDSDSIISNIQTLKIIINGYKKRYGGHSQINALYLAIDTMKDLLREQQKKQANKGWYCKNCGMKDGIDETLQVKDYKIARAIRISKLTGWEEGYSYVDYVQANQALVALAKEYEGVKDWPKKHKLKCSRQETSLGAVYFLGTPADVAHDEKAKIRNEALDECRLWVVKQREKEVKND